MYKMVFLIAASSLLLFGCANGVNTKQTTASTNGEKQVSIQVNNENNIDEFSKEIHNTLNTFFDKILSNNSKLSNEQVSSSKTLIDAKIKTATQEYAKLMQANLSGNSKDEVDMLKKVLDKEQEMTSILEHYLDNVDSNKKTLSDDWTVAGNYLNSYYEMTKVK